MNKIYYPAVVERSSDGYYLSFPDFPGCVAGGDNLFEAIASAETALAMHISGMVEDGEGIPEPGDPTAVPVDPDVRMYMVTMVGAVTAPRIQRVNITLDTRLLAAIDANTSNRSAFLAEAAREKLQTMTG